MAGVIRRHGWIVAFALCFGLAAMAPRHLSRSLWLDEAWVVEFAREPTARETLDATLQDGRPAPAGYMVLMHAIDRFVDGRPWVYRLPAWLAASSLLIAISTLAARHGGSALVGAFAGVVLLASPAFQRYAFEVKPYAVEAALAVWIVIASGGNLRTPQTALVWLVLGLGLVAMGFGGLFALAASAVVVTGRILLEPTRGLILRWWAPALGGVAVAGGLVWVTYTSELAKNRALHDYWQAAFLSGSWRTPIELWGVVVDWLAGVSAAYPTLPAYALPAAAVAGLGAWVIRRPGAGVAALLALLIAAGLSLSGRWPMAARTNLPLVWLLHCAAAFGAAEVWTRIRPYVMGTFRGPIAVAGAVLSALTFVVMLVVVVHDGRRAPVELMGVTSLLDHLSEMAEPGDRVVLDGAAFVNQELAPRPIAGTISRGPWFYETPAQVIEAVRPSLGVGRAWLAVSHSHGTYRPALDQAARAMAVEGVLELAWEGRNVALYTFRPR